MPVKVATTADSATALPVSNAAPRMAYWQPAPELAGLVSGYHLYAVSPGEGEVHRDTFQPSWFNLRILRDPATQWSVRWGNEAPQRVPDVALFGPSGTAFWSQSDTGTVIGAGITPLGWSRLGRVPAATLANRVVPADSVLGKTVRDLAGWVRGSSEDAIPTLLDRWLGAMMRPPSRDDAAIARLSAALLDPAICTVAELGRRTDLAPRTLERLSSKAFGFPPKLLLRRARFLRSLHALIAGGPGRRAIAIDAGYTDYSHFIREAHEFLGTSPTRFLETCGPMFRQSLVLRKAVLGEAAQALSETARRSGKASKS